MLAENGVPVDLLGTGFEGWDLLSNECWLVAKFLIGDGPEAPASNIGSYARPGH